MNIARLTALTAALTALLSTAALAGGVSGTVLDEQGRPIANALVWVQPALSGYGSSGNLVEVRTDAKGRYKAESLLNTPYFVKAWRTLKFEGQTYCHRLGMARASDYASFVPKGTGVRDFKAQFRGLIGDELSNAGTFGGEVRAMHDFDDESDVHEAREIVVTYTPLALAGGGSLKAFTRTVSTGKVLMEDIPIGRYRVTAVAAMPSGEQRPLKVSVDDETYAASAVLTFKPTGKCDAGSGLERAFLYYSGE